VVYLQQIYKKKERNTLT